AHGPVPASKRSNSLSCLNSAQLQGISRPASRIARGGWGPGCEVVAGARGRGRRGPVGATGGCARISLDPVSRGATCARRGHYATSRRRDVHCGPRAARARFASAGRLTELYSHGELPLWPHATHADRVTGVALSQEPAQVARVVQLFVVDVRDDVTLAKARPVRRRVGGNVEHDRAAGDRQPELLR